MTPHPNGEVFWGVKRVKLMIYFLQNFLLYSVAWFRQSNYTMYGNDNQGTVCRLIP